MSHMDTKSSRDFNLVAAIRALAAGSFHKLASLELAAHRKLEAEYGPAPGNAIRVPVAALTRDLTVASASGGGYLASTRVGGYVESIRRVFIGGRLGVAVETLTTPAGPLAVPTGNADATATWLSTESAQTSESTPTFGQAVATPRLLSVFVEVSRQLLIQSTAGRVIADRLAIAAGKALDTALVAGSGASGEPTGILNTPGVGSVTGTSLAYAGIVEFQQDVADAEGVENPDALGWSTTPTVAGLLMARHKVASTASPLWEGNLSAGQVCSRPAYASKSMPAGTAIYGDWSGVQIVEWDGAAIEVDPFSKFTAGIVGVRLLLPCDVLTARPKAFSVASSIT